LKKQQQQMARLIELIQCDMQIEQTLRIWRQHWQTIDDNTRLHSTHSFDTLKS